MEAYKTDRFVRRIIHLMSFLHATALYSLRARTEHFEGDGLNIMYSHMEAKRKGHAYRAKHSKDQPNMPSDFDKVQWNNFLKDKVGYSVDGTTGEFVSLPHEGKLTRVEMGTSLPVIGGVSIAERQILRKQHDQLTTILSWVTQEIVARIKEGGLRMPPPILTRLLQELSNGMLGYNQAYKMVERPFPFPYVQVVFMLLFTHLIFLPVVLVQYTDEPYMAATLSFLSIQMFFALELTAREIENCFGMDANDLDLQGFQYDFNVLLDSLIMETPDAALKQVCALPEHWDVAVPDCFLVTGKLPESRSTPLGDEAIPRPIEETETQAAGVAGSG